MSKLQPYGLNRTVLVREYLLAKWGRQCVYCGAKDIPLEIEHIQPKSRGGSNRVSNLTLACNSCNQRKSNQDVRDFLTGQPDLLQRLLKQAKAPLKDAAAVNATRWHLWRSLKALGLPLTTGTGGRTKFNRCRLALPKQHWIDAACVGNVDSLQLCTAQPLLIKAAGHGSRQVIHVYGNDAPKASWPTGAGFQRRNRSGELVRKSAKVKSVRGFQTGDIVRAVVSKTTKTKTAGVHVGRVAVRSSGSFNITTRNGVQQGVNWKACTPIHRGDGYSYAF